VEARSVFVGFREATAYCEGAKLVNIYIDGVYTGVVVMLPIYLGAQIDACNESQTQNNTSGLSSEYESMRYVLWIAKLLMGFAGVRGSMEELTKNIISLNRILSKRHERFRISVQAAILGYPSETHRHR